MPIKRNFNKSSLDDLPTNKPVIYRIQTPGGKDNYIGTAKRGRGGDRIKEHIGEIPGATVIIEQTDSIADARKKEERLIKRNNPKYNKQHNS